ncbi:HNH endonuclease [Demequina pelophila]|uniref:HNH endonuclease n=1 Tax=Demequina pelophila TaxID=1638984 RepID=UPI0007832D2C|nr:HNH endonuclease [Demequina pelophila]
MHLIDDSGRVLDADFDVEYRGAEFDIVVESRGGSAQAGTARNPDYDAALTCLVDRCRKVGALIDDAYVDSRTVQELPLSDRRIVEGTPGRVIDGDVGTFIAEIKQAQTVVGRAPGAKGGNPTKRIRIKLRLVPALEEEQLLDLLVQGSLIAATAEEIARSLVGVAMRTASGRPNTIQSVSDGRAVVATGKSPEGTVVDLDGLETALARLRADGRVVLATPVVGYRSAFVGAVLLTLPGVGIVGSAPLTMGWGGHKPSGAGKARSTRFEGELYREVTARQRREQATLRTELLAGRDEAECALCGETYPARFLWAAHIKRRSVADETEKRDLQNIAMLACVFGCDALYEDGLIAITGPDGAVAASPQVEGGSALESRIEAILGRRIDRYVASKASQTYFEWHEEHVFRK